MRPNLKFVKYDGTASGYVILFGSGISSQATGGLNITKGMVIALSDNDFELLKKMGHIGEGKLEEVQSSSSSPDAVFAG